MSGRLGSPAGPGGAVMVDVARLAGVSQKTVSRVVNNAPYVRPDVRDECAGRSRNWVTGRTSRPRRWPGSGTTPSACCALGTPLFGPSRRVFTLEQAARRHGYTLALASVPDLSATSVAEGIDSLLQRGVEGLVIEVPTHLVEFDAAPARGVAGGHQCRLDRRPAAAGGRSTSTRATSAAELTALPARPRATRPSGISPVRVTGMPPRSGSTAGVQPCGQPGRPVPRVLYGDWSAASGYASGLHAGRTIRRHGDLRRQRPHGDGRAAGLRRGRPVGSRATSRSSASTTCPRRSSRWCR